MCLLNYDMSHHYMAQDMRDALLPRPSNPSVYHLNCTVDVRQHSYHKRKIQLFIIRMSNWCECIGVNGEALQLHAVYIKSHIYIYIYIYIYILKSRKNSYQYYKSCQLHLNVQ